MKAAAILQYRKDPRVVIAVPLLLVMVTSFVYYVIERTKELTPEALSSRLLLFVLWNINLILILGILFVFLRAVIKLVLERQRGIIGSRFRTKLVATYVATSLVPIVLLFIVATDLLRVSIDRWFNLPVEQLLANGEQIALGAQERAMEEASLAANEVAQTLRGTSAGEIDRALVHVRRFHNVDLIGIYEGRIVSRLLANPAAPVHEIGEPSSRFFDEVAEKGSAKKIDVGTEGKWLRYAVRIGPPERDRVALAGVHLPASLARAIDANLVTRQHYEQLDAQRPALKASQTSLFLTVTLFLLFGALWTAIVVARRITTPIQALADGTRTLANGDYGHRIMLRAGDEFGLLIDSFNRMAEQLESQRQAVTESNERLQEVNRRLDEERSYLATVLGSVSTGILSFDDQLRLASINHAALRILGIERPPSGSTASALFRGELRGLGEYIEELGERPLRPKQLTIFSGSEVRYLDVSAARLSGEGGEGGWVIAIEETTELVRAQKLAAWSEAARRIAHEIKNPLTPIQLSAERIARKFRSGDPEVGGAIDDGCRTIVSEVGQLKRMVDEFSRFARMPVVHLEQTSISEILEQLARLYCEVKPAVRIRAEAEPSLSAVVDGEQIRRALINLLDNAIEATDEGEIVVSARRERDRLVIDVTDPGRGVPDDDKEKLFLPYFSTKGGGTGLGLAIVHRIVADHDGRITVHDARPRGTRFHIEIPA